MDFNANQREAYSASPTQKSYLLYWAPYTTFSTATSSFIFTNTMDPLSITAGVIAVVQVTATCLKLCSRPLGSSEYETATLKRISADCLPSMVSSGIYKPILRSLRGMRAGWDICPTFKSRWPAAKIHSVLLALVKRNDSRIPRLVGTHVTRRRFDRRLSQALAILKSSGGVLQFVIQADEL